jgi:hypothetical protein
VVECIFEAGGVEGEDGVVLHVGGGIAGAEAEGCEDEDGNRH